MIRVLWLYVYSAREKGRCLRYAFRQRELLKNICLKTNRRNASACLHNTEKQAIKAFGNFGDFESTKKFFDFNRVYYNSIRKHTALDFITPAEASGIFLNLGRNRFLSLIKILLNSKIPFYCS